MTVEHSTVVLVAVLDWGLGHAARSIPLIEGLVQQGAKVIMAGHGRSGALLRKSFPDLPFLDCPPYGIHYRGRHFYGLIFRQLPKIGYAVLSEYRWLRRLVKQMRIDAVISDSRFGCFLPGIPSILIAHQLRLPLRPAWLSRLINWIYQRHLRRFDEVWIPDFPNGLSGSLAYPSPIPNTHYLGYLSRFRPEPQTTAYDLLVLLSGPEPQRTFLEEIIGRQLQKMTQLRTLIVQGKTEENNRYNINPHLEIVSYLSGSALQQALAQTELVLCRSGYSSLMDLAAARKKAILVPTPGQPEQEYLAERCMAMDWAVVQKQQQLNLEQALKDARAGHRKWPHDHYRHELDDRLTVLIKSFLARIGSSG